MLAGSAVLPAAKCLCLHKIAADVTGELPRRTLANFGERLESLLGTRER